MARPATTVKIEMNGIPMMGDLFLDLITRALIEQLDSDTTAEHEQPVFETVQNNRS